MIDYQKGKVYKIISSHTDKIYIGSTCQLLCKRFVNHKIRYNSYNKSKSGYTSSYEILNFGINDSKIILIQNYPCNNKEELTSKEAEYIKLYNSIIVNKYIPGRSSKEYYQDNKNTICDKVKDYRDLNREIISEKQKQYRYNNKDIISEKQKQRYQDNKTIILNKVKIYSQNNKNKISEQKKQYAIINRDKIRLKKCEIKICECGSNTSTSHYLRHKRTLIHQQNLSKIIYTKIIFID